MATPPNGISPLHVIRAELAQKEAAGRQLSLEVLRLQRVEIQLSAVIKALIGGNGMEKSIPVADVHATMPSTLRLNVEDGLLTIQCIAPPPPEQKPEGDEKPPTPRILTP